MKKLIIGFTVGFLALFLGLRFFWQTPSVPKDIRMLSQNPRDYALDKEFTPFQNTFKDALFKPWDQYDPQNVPDYAFDYQIDDYVDASGTLYPESFGKSLSDNSAVLSYPNSLHKAITVRGTQLRLIPSHDPLYTPLSSPTFGPPFDEAAAVFVHAYTPILVYHLTHDEKFALVSTVQGSALFWMDVSDFALVSDEFETAFRGYALKTPMVDGLFLDLNTQVFIGGFVPTQGNFAGIVSKNPLGGYAEILFKEFPEDLLSAYPLSFSSKQLMAFAASMQGPYIWGGRRDCSSFLRDLFAPFGLHVKGNSFTQSNTFQSVDVSGFSNSQKKEALIKQGIPFQTLVYFPGHIMLYIGEKDGEPLVLHMVWGLRTRDPFLRSKRYVLGRMVISTLDLGKDFFTVRFFKMTPLDRMTKIVFLTKPVLEGSTDGD